MSSYWLHRLPSAMEMGDAGHAALPRFVEPWKSIDDSPMHDLLAGSSQELAFRQLLVPLDGSLASEHAIPYAIQIARRSRADIRLVYVHRQLKAGFHGTSVRTDADVNLILREPMEVYLADLRKRIARATGVDVDPALVKGQRAAEALSALTPKSDLIVMATRGRGSLRRLWRGSFLDSLRARSATPILHVRGYQCPAALTSRPALRRGLAAIDGSPRSKEILAAAAKLAALDRGMLTLLQVVSSNGRALANTSTRSPGQGRPHPLAALDRLAADHRREDALAISTSVVWTDDRPGRAILQHAVDGEADFIALAPQLVSGLTRALRPGIYDYLLRHSYLPILIG